LKFVVAFSIYFLIGGSGCNHRETPVNPPDGEDQENRDIGNGSLTFPDANLDAAVRTALGRSEQKLTQSDLQSLEQLMAREQDIVDLSGIGRLSNLSFLDVGNNKIQDISPLDSLSQLRFLNLENNQVKDLSTLAALPQLQILIIDGNQVQDLSPLLELRELTNLELSGNPLDEESLNGHIPLLIEKGIQVVGMQPAEEQVPELEGIVFPDPNLDKAIREQIESDLIAPEDLLLIRTLTVSDNIADLSGVEKLQNLTHLYIEQVPENMDLSPLTTLTQLEKLFLSGAHTLDFSPLSSLSSLTSLVILSIPIRSPKNDLAFLTHLVHLKELTMIGNHFSEMPGLVAFLIPLPELSSLNLGFNEITDISSLSDLNQLRTLRLRDNHIEDISVLSSFSGLLWLEINNNEIQDLSVLLELPKLRIAIIVNNPLSEVSINVHVPALRSKGVRLEN
jgi:internalin A